MNRIIVPITAAVSAVICAAIVTLFARGQGLGGSSAAADLSPMAVITATAPLDVVSAQASSTASPSSSSSSGSQATTSVSQPASGELRTYSAGDGGTATFRFDGRTVSLESANPNAGWDTFVDSQGPREIELDFVSGSRTLRMNAEVDDGALRVRLEERKSSDGNSGRSDDDDSDSSEDDDDSHSGSNRGRDHDEDD